MCAGPTRARYCGGERAGRRCRLCRGARLRHSVRRTTTTQAHAGRVLTEGASCTTLGDKSLGRLAAAGTKVGLNFVRLGITPGMGSTYTLRTVTNPQVAAAFLLTGETMTYTTRAPTLRILMAQMTSELGLCARWGKVRSAGRRRPRPWVSS